METLGMKSLDTIMNELGADKGTVWHGYCPLYESLFYKWRNEPIRMLEIGTQAFCSVKAWLEYFTKAQIYGVDVWRGEPFVDNPRFHFYQGNQRDTAFWDKFKSEVPPFEIIVDDAEHRAEAIKISFDALWPHVWPGGYYIIEDVHSLWTPEFVSPSISGEQLIGYLFANLNWHSKAYHGHPNPAPYQLTHLESTLESIYCVKGLIVLKKRDMGPLPA